MGRIDELIAEGKGIADDLNRHLGDLSQRLETNWLTLNAWHDAGVEYVRDNSPHNLGRIRLIEVADTPSNIHASVDSLLSILKAIRGAGSASPAPQPAAAPAVQESPAKPIKGRGWRRIVDVPMNLLRDPLLQGITAVMTIVAAVAGLIWATGK
jgi:hypothetical protein